MLDTVLLPDVGLAAFPPEKPIGLRPSQIDALYDLLVEHLGSPDNIEARHNFLNAYSGAVTPTEYRTGRRLGAGGALCYIAGTLTVSMAPEHRTPGRVAIQQKADAALATFLAGK